MASIVKLPPPRRERSQSPETEAGATILFFTGIRYERDVEEIGIDDAALSLIVASERVAEEAATLACR